MRSSQIILVGPKSNDKHPYKRKAERGLRQMEERTHREADVKIRHRLKWCGHKRGSQGMLKAARN